MKKSVKAFWSMCAAMLVMGIAFMLTGAAMGANTRVTIGKDWNLQFSRWGNRQSSTEAVRSGTRIDEHDLPAFEAIEVDIIAADIEVICSNHYGLTAELSGRGDETKLDWSIENGRLRLEEERIGRFSDLDFKLFPFPHLFGWNDWESTGEFPEGRILIYLPQDARLNQVGLSTVSGSLRAEGLRAQEFSGEVVSGSGDLQNCSFERFWFSSVSGEVKVSNSALGYASIETVSNNVELTDVSTEGLSYDSVSGNLEFSGQLRGNTTIDGISGDARFSIDGKREDYRIEQHGSVKIQNESAGGAQSAPNRISVSMPGGDVEITFR